MIGRYSFGNISPCIIERVNSMIDPFMVAIECESGSQNKPKNIELRSNVAKYTISYLVCVTHRTLGAQVYPPF